MTETITARGFMEYMDEMDQMPYALQEALLPAPWKVPVEGFALGLHTEERNSYNYGFFSIKEEVFLTDVVSVGEVIPTGYGEEELYQMLQERIEGR